MTKQGFILLHRSIQDHWIYEEPRNFSRYEAWLDILMMVNHKDARTLQDGELVEVKRGERITSIRQLMDRWKWSNTKVVKYLELLQIDGMIVCEITPKKKTLIKVLQYEQYQGFAHGDENEKKTPTNFDIKNNAEKKDTKKTGDEVAENEQQQGFDEVAASVDESEKRHEKDTETTQNNINNNDNKGTKKPKKDYTQQIKNLLARYVEIDGFMQLQKEYWNVIRETRVTNKVGQSIIASCMAKWEKYEPVVVHYAIKEHVEMHAGKRENYTIGIMRGTGADEARDKLAFKQQPVTAQKAAGGVNWEAIANE